MNRGEVVGSERVRRRPHPALDPPHSAASPAVPALIGPGAPLLALNWLASDNPDRSRRSRLELRNLLKLAQDLLLMLRQVARDPRVGEQLGQVPLCQHEIEMVIALG